MMGSSSLEKSNFEVQLQLRISMALAMGRVFFHIFLACLVFSFAVWVDYFFKDSEKQRSQPQTGAQAAVPLC